MKRIVLVSGTASTKVSKKISDYLDVPLVDPQVVKFKNGETFCEIEKHVRGADVYVIQSSSPPVNDNLMELLIMIDALKRASADSITAVVPHFGYARQDRKVSPRSPITAKLVADLITVAGANRVITMDLHAGQIQGFFNIPFDNIFAFPVLLDHIKKEMASDNITFVSPDAGGVERVRLYSKKINGTMALIDKTRTGKNVAHAMSIIGDVKDRDCIIIDDMIDTAGTLVEACRILKEQGAKKVYALATHGLFSGEAIERIQNCEALDKVIVTDTISHRDEVLKCSKITVVTISEILAKAIHRTFNNDSVSSLFI